MRKTNVLRPLPKDEAMEGLSIGVINIATSFLFVILGNCSVMRYFLSEWTNRHWTRSSGVGCEVGVACLMATCFYLFPQTVAALALLHGLVPSGFYNFLIGLLAAEVGFVGLMCCIIHW